MLALLLCAGLIISAACGAGCRKGSGRRAGQRFDSDELAPLDKLLAVYGPAMVDIEYRSSTTGQAHRSLGVLLGGDAGRALILTSLDASAAAGQAAHSYRVYMAGREERSVRLAASYLADVNAALLLADMPAGFTMDLADESVLWPGCELGVIYLTSDGRTAVTEAVIESAAAPDAAHVANFLARLPEGVDLTDGVVFARRGGGLAGIVNPAARPGRELLEVIPAINLTDAAYWQYAADRYEISQMLNGIRRAGQ